MNLLNRLLIRHCNFVHSFGESISISDPILIKNIKRNIKHWKKIVLDIDKVEVSKTADTDNYVITIINNKGQKVSLWLNKNNEVNSITSY